MLRRVDYRHPDSAVSIDPPQPETIDVDTVLAAARRQPRFVSIFGAAGLLLGFVYLQNEVPLYQSTTKILIDKNQPPVVRELMENAAPTQPDPMMGSQVELLRSERIGLKVVDSLGLATDQTFLSEPYSLS